MQVTQKAKAWADECSAVVRSSAQMSKFVAIRIHTSMYRGVHNRQVIHSQSRESLTHVLEREIENEGPSYPFHYYAEHEMNC